MIRNKYDCVSTKVGLRATKELNCSVPILDWVLLLLTLVILCVVWWVVEIPALFARQEADQPPNLIGRASRPKKSRTRRFFDALAWNCVRNLMPSYVAIIAIARAKDSQAWPAVYYFGYEINRGSENSASSKTLSPRRWVNIFIQDGVLLVVACTLIYRGITAAREQNTTMFFATWLANAAVPAAVGVYLLAIALVLQPPRRLAIGLGFGVLVLFGALLISAAYFSSRLNQIGGPYYLGALILGWAISMLPLTLAYCCEGHFRILFYALSATLRTAPFLVDLLRLSEVFTNCSIDTRGLAAGYSVLAGMLVWGMAPYGADYCEDFRDKLRELARPDTDNRRVRNEYLELENGSGEARRPNV
jgi:hypothetical protein